MNQATTAYLRLFSFLCVLVGLTSLVWLSSPAYGALLSPDLGHTLRILPNHTPGSSDIDTLQIGLVAYYNFNDGSSTDLSGNGNHGTIFGTPQTVSGIEGNALKFGGFNDPDHIIVPNSSTLSFNDNFTFSIWFNIQSHVSMTAPDARATEYGVQTLIAKSGDRNGFVLRAERKLDDNRWYPHALNGRCCDPPTDVVNIWTKDGNGIDLESWHMASVTYGNGLVKFYLDGQLQEELGTADFNLNPSMANEPLHIGIGQFLTNPDIQWYPLNGILDEARVYNRVLSASEIQSLYTLFLTNKIYLPQTLR